MFMKIIFTLLATLMLIPAMAAEKSPKPLVYVIPIQKEIDDTTLFVVRRGIDEAVRNEADAIVFDMNTPGGELNATIKILSVIEKTEIPTYTFINDNAYSAGAIISMATKHIYMAPGSVIGAATPLSISPTGGVMELPDEIQEKMTSAVAAKIRAAAEQGGHDPHIADAMVRADIEYSINGKVISEKGELLTLTNEEAATLVGEDPHPLLSEGTVDSLDELLAQIDGLAGAKKIFLKISAAERFARFIEGIAPILLMIGLGGIWMEIKTPGFGIFGIAGFTCLALFFIGHHIAGLSGFEDALLFIIGVALLIVEVFITPGFGMMGISGIILIMISLVSAMTEHLPGKWEPVSFSMDTFTWPLAKLLISFIGTGAIIMLAGRFLPQTQLFHKMSLSTVSPKVPNQHELIGKEGIAHSDLRPGGVAYFGDRKLDVVTLGDYIASQTPINIIEVHGNRIVVEKTSASQNKPQSAHR